MITPAKPEHLSLFFAVRLDQEDIQHGHQDAEAGNAVDWRKISHSNPP